MKVPIPTDSTKEGFAFESESKVEGVYEVNITRQTSANLTGLRVETVI